MTADGRRRRRSTFQLSHSTEVEAESLYEAAVLGIRRLNGAATPFDTRPLARLRRLRRPDCWQRVAAPPTARGAAPTPALAARPSPARCDDVRGAAGYAYSVFHSGVVQAFRPARHGGPEVRTTHDRKRSKRCGLTVTIHEDLVGLRKLGASTSPVFRRQASNAGRRGDSARARPARRLSICQR